MRKNSRRRLLFLSMFFLLVLPITVQTEEKLAFDLTREVLVTRLKNVLDGNDVNTIRRNLIDRRFSPLHAMATYRELLLWSTKADKNDPFWREIVDLVREGMVAAIRDSSMGIPLNGWEGEGVPVSVLYMNSYPAYKQTPDFNDLNTLKWRDDLFAEVVTPGSIGLSLSAKALIISIDESQAGKKHAPLMLSSALQELDILTQQHFLKKRWVEKSKDSETAGVVKIQGKESKRAVKMVLSPAPKALSKAADKKILMDALGPMDEETYVPEQLMLPTDKTSWQVKYDTSRLSSQASLLEGLLYMHQLLADDAKMQSLMVNGMAEGKKLDDWRKLVRQAIDVVFATIIEKHFDTATGSFTDTYQPEKGVGNRVAFDDANRAINVLEQFASSFPEDKALQKKVHKYILSQVAFIEKSQGEKSEIPRGYMLKNGAHMTGLMREFTGALSYVSIMLAAENIVGDGSYKRLAEKQFEIMHTVFWSEVGNVYRLSAGLKVSTYTGVSFAMVMEWLRRMDAMLPDAIDAKMSARNYIEVVLVNSGLLQSEGPVTGEPKQPEYYIENEVDALYARLKEGGVDKLAASIEEFLDQASDQDGDGLLGVRFSGDKTGGAPVITMQVGVKTPIISGVGTGLGDEVQRNYGF
ncbi:hypothetical protein ACFL3U_03000 [Pseudomonadota bacterium]